MQKYCLLLAVGGGVVQGSGMVQDELDLEVGGVMVVWAELVTDAMWCTEGPVVDTCSI